MSHIEKMKNSHDSWAFCDAKDKQIAPDWRLAVTMDAKSGIVAFGKARRHASQREKDVMRHVGKMCGSGWIGQFSPNVVDTLTQFLLGPWRDDDLIHGAPF